MVHRPITELRELVRRELHPAPCICHVAVLVTNGFHVLCRIVVGPVEQHGTGSEEGFDIVLWLPERLPDNIRDRGFTTESKGMELLIL